MLTPIVPVEYLKPSVVVDLVKLDVLSVGLVELAARIPNTDAIGLPPAPIPILSLGCGRASPMAANNAALALANVALFALLLKYSLMLLWLM